MLDPPLVASGNIPVFAEVCHFFCHWLHFAVISCGFADISQTVQGRSLSAKLLQAISKKWLAEEIEAFFCNDDKHLSASLLEPRRSMTWGSARSNESVSPKESL
jgi:hypothetical protein